MGFVECRPFLGHRVMTAKDYIWLAVLGAAERCPLSIDRVGEAVSDLAGSQWTPVSQLVFDAVAEMQADGLLTTETNPSILAVSAEGRRRLEGLLALPLASPITPFGQVGIRLKLAFLDLASPQTIRRQIAAILGACQCEIALRTSDCQAWRLNGPLGRAWLDHQVEMLEETSALLRGLARQLA